MLFRGAETRSFLKDIYATGTRQITVDVLRGYFILSMASAHVSKGLLDHLLHVWVWVDGAAGFVCLSGFVLGLSQKARWIRGNGHAGQIWILRRAGQIWLVSTALTAAALLARLYSDKLIFIEDVFHDARLASAAIDLLLQQLSVPYFSILGMYVAFLVFAFFAVGALKRSLTVIVLLASLAIYGLSQVMAVLWPPAIGAQQFSWPAWQLLFFMGLLAGWHWQDRLRPLARKARPWIFPTSILGVVVLVPLAHPKKIAFLGLDWDLSGFFLKFTLNPPVVLYFLLVLAFLANLVELVRRWTLAAPALRAVALLGRHSLGCFVILSLLQLATWIALTPHSPQDARHIAWFPVALALFFAYGLMSEMSAGRRPAPARRLSAAAVSRSSATRAS
jgi:hypothetical protein